MTETHVISSAALFMTLSFLAGCASNARNLMPTPTLYRAQPASALFGAIPQERRRPQVELLYITDRMPQADSETGLPYGEKRASSMAFGTAVVEMVPELTWPELERQSRLAKRSAEINLEMGRIEELGRFPEEPYALKVMPSGVQRARNVVVAHEKSKAEFRSELQRRVEQSLDGEVMLYVHGFNETFSTAAYTTAELCHFLGREHACAFSTWPASASGGFLRSYTRTTESAEYAVGHLTKNDSPHRTDTGCERSAAACPQPWNGGFVACSVRVGHPEHRGGARAGGRSKDRQRSPPAPRHRCRCCPPKDRTIRFGSGLDLSLVRGAPTAPVPGATDDLRFPHRSCIALLHDPISQPKTRRCAQP